MLVALSSSVLLLAAQVAGEGTPAPASEPARAPDAPAPAADVAGPAAPAATSGPAAPAATDPSAATPLARGDLRILVVAADSERAEALYGGLRAAGLLVVELPERVGVDLAAPPPATPGGRDAARAHMQEARGHMRELDTAAARDAIDRALDDVMHLEHPEDARELWVDALLFRANLAVVDARDDDARDDFMLAARLDPAREALDAGLYSPSVVDAYAQARALARAAPLATLVVRPRAAGFAPVEVLVDGQPFTGEPLPSGVHAVTARAVSAKGTHVAQRTVVVALSPEAPVVLAPFLAPPDAPALRAALVERIRAAAAPDVAALESLALACAARAILVELAPREAANAAAREARDPAGAASAAGAPHAPELASTPDSAQAPQLTQLTLWVAGRGLVPVDSATREPNVIGDATLDALQNPTRRRDDPPPENDTWIVASVGAGIVGVVVASAGAAATAWSAQPPAKGLEGRLQPRAVEVAGPRP